MSLVTNLTPVSTNTLGWLGWRRGLIGVEPVPVPDWTEAAPDPAAIDAWIRQQNAHLARDHEAAVGTVRYFTPLVRSAIVAIAFAVLAGVFLIVTFAASDLKISDFVQTPDESAANPAEPPTALSFAAFVALFGPWFAAAVLTRRRRLVNPRARTFLLGLGLWFLAFVLAIVTAGLSFVLLPAAVGVFALLSRPMAFHSTHGTTVRAEAGALRMWRASRRQATASRQALRGLDGRIRAEIEHAQREYAERRQEHDKAALAHVPFAIVDPPETQDLIVVGGSTTERGDLVHHIGAALTAGDRRIWVLDLEGRTATDRLLVETTARGRTTGLVRADDEAALADLLDILGTVAARQSSVLTEVLAYALAHDGDGRAVTRSRETLDTLRRIEPHLRYLPGGVTVARLHDALDALLAGRGPGGDPGHDDFGMGPAAPGVDPAGGLPASALDGIRASFGQQDRQHFYPVWTDLRIKLASLLPDNGTADAAHDPWRWSTENLCDVTVVPHTLGRADRELRISLLLSHHLRLLRSGATKPAAVVVIGAGHASAELLTELSETATAGGVQLVLSFNELVPTVEEMALGRRNIAVFGGHGAQAAERLADLFGRDWISRVRSYQDTWSVAEAESRAESSGRTWSTSLSRQRSDSRSFTSSTSHGSSSGGAGAGGATSHSYGTTRGVTNSTSRTETEGGSFTESVTAGRTDTQGGARSTNVDYDRLISGSEISALPPFTMLLKHGVDVRLVDVKADLELPVQLTAVTAPR